MGEDGAGVVRAIRRLVQPPSSRRRSSVPATLQAGSTVGAKWGTVGRTESVAASARNIVMPDCGTITLKAPRHVTAGSRVTLTFTYTVGRLGMRRGGSLRIRTPNDAWEAPRAHKKQLPKGVEGRGFSIHDATYCTHNKCNLRASLQAKSRARIEVRDERTAGPLCQYMVAGVRDDDLAEGDAITLVYGDRTWGEDGVAAQKVAPTPDDRFVAHVDVNGNGDFLPLDDASLTLTVRPGPLSRFSLVARAIVRPQELLELKVAGMDAFRNQPDTPWEGELRLGCNRPDISLPGAITLHLPGEKVPRTIATPAVPEAIQDLFRSDRPDGTTE